ncbi:MAG: single-stranded DNA-binding protein, partial [Thiobacillus sp.]|nr:single-stranded DNA-binding protein [Thiobacillus sp.]
RKYTDKNGVERTAYEIRGDRMQMLGGRSGGGMADMDDGYNQAPPPSRAAAQPAGGARGAPQQRPASGGFDDMDDDIPF